MKCGKAGRGRATVHYFDPMAPDMRTRSRLAPAPSAPSSEAVFNEIKKTQRMEIMQMSMIIRTKSGAARRPASPWGSPRAEELSCRSTSVH